MRKIVTPEGLEAMEFYYLPKEYHAIHSACSELVKQIEEFIVKDEYQFLKVSTSPMTPEELKRLEECGDIWDFLKKYREEQFYTQLNKQLILGLLMDFCYFMQESLDCSNKMRLVVSYALLRRPLVDNLRFLLRILADDSFYDKFIERDDYDPANMSDGETKAFLEATDEIRLTKPITGEFIFECIYDKNNPGSVINLSNRAIHPVTTRPWNKTGAMNCNFMFVTGNDIAELWKHYYAYLPAILIFYSELFNCAVFSLFKDEVDMELYPKRIEAMAKVLGRSFTRKDEEDRPQVGYEK